MYASTKKNVSWGLILLVIVGVVALGAGGSVFYSYWKAQQEPVIELELNPPTPRPLEEALPPPEPATFPNEQQQVSQDENASLLAQIETLEVSKEQFEQLQLGRAVLDDFAQQFFKYESILNNASFFQFFRGLVFDYIENRAISVKQMKESDPAFGKAHEEFVAWVIAQEDEKLVALAQFVGFYLVEHLYQLPLTLLASGLSAEIQAIDFESPVVVLDQETPPIRDGNGELKMNEKASLDRYTSAQQFLYRRGPQFSAKVLVVLEAYLAYEGY